jgi:hypothetical protein
MKRIGVGTEDPLKKMIPFLIFIGADPSRAAQFCRAGFEKVEPKQEPERNVTRSIEEIPEQT